MKKLLVFSILLIILLIFAPVYAEGKHQEPVPTEIPLVVKTPDVFKFSQLGFTETRLISPFDSTGLQFSFPEEWKFEQSGLLHLEYSLSIYGVDYVEGTSQIGGVLNISINNASLASIPLNKIGDNVVDISLSPKDLISQQTDGRLDISFDLISQESCTRNIDVDVIIRETSYLQLPYTSITPLVDLTLLPRPFFQPDSLFERKVILVVPDKASDAELQAAMDVSEGLGNLTNGTLVVDLVMYSNLTSEMINSEHLILIGKPGSIPMMAELDTPIKLVNSQFNYSAAGAEDGLIQEIVSPWNSIKAILIISGNSDAGVVKSGQAIKSGEILTAGQNNISFIQDYRAQNPATSLSLDQSFKDLGYDNRTITFAGNSSIYIDFYISPQQQVSSDAYLNLHFNNSSILQFDTSGMTILINGHAVNSIQFQASTAQLTEAQIKLPPSVFLQGPNQLLIQVRLAPINDCSQIEFSNSTWATIFNDSILHLPTVQSSVGQFQSINLADYPDAMVSGPSLGNLTFVLDKNNETSLKTASAIAFGLGNDAGNIMNQIKIMDANSVNPDELGKENVMIIGRPSGIPLIFDLKENLPAPFENGSEIPLDTVSRVVYRVLPGSDVGYLEMFVSPWNTERLALLVSANSDKGLNLAGSALTGGDFQGNLAGNFAIISSGKIIGLDTRFPVSSELLSKPNPTPGGEGIPTGTSQNPLSDRNWMIPFIAVVSLLTFVVVIMVLIPALRKSKNDK
jgi:hypothetical protein